MCISLTPDTTNTLIAPIRGPNLDPGRYFFANPSFQILYRTAHPNHCLTTLLGSTFSPPSRKLLRTFDKKTKGYGF